MTDGSHAIVAAGRSAGLFSKTARGWEQIDATHTWALDARGARVARGIETSGVRGVAFYDRVGVERYLRVAGIKESNLSLGDDGVALTADGSAGVRFLALNGTTTGLHAGDGTVAGVAMIAGRWYAVVSNADGARLAALPDARTLACGLPPLTAARYADGLWAGIDAPAGDLVAFDAIEGHVLFRGRCAGARALAVDDEFVYAGNSEIIAFRRSDWQIAWRIPAPCDDYLLASVPHALVASLGRGFTNPVRTPEQLQLRILAENGCSQPRTLWPCGHPLPWDAFRANVSAALPMHVEPGSRQRVETTIVNTSDCYFTSVAPAPVFVSYKWLDPSTNAFVDDTHARRTPLARTILPGATLTMHAEIDTPARAGTFRLRLTLMQEGVTWFDEHDPQAYTEMRTVVA